MGDSSEHPPLLSGAQRYWTESRQPLASLLFIAPLLIAYEVGVLWLHVRPNGADDFMRRLLDLLGFGQHFLLPGLMVAILLGWHYLSRQSWRVSPGVVPTMAVEAILLGLFVRAMAFAQHSFVGLSLGEGIDAPCDTLRTAAGYLGAGIYEELLFRLILLSLLAWAFRHAGAKPRIASIAAVALSSLLFAAAHNLGPCGEPFHGFAFLFRTLAGVFFSLVFVYRGFGIAAGSHAAYDILVGVL